MKRTTVDKLAAAVGFTITAVLIVSGVLLTWAHNFVGDQVKTQLSAQKIFFPPKGSPAIAGPNFTAMQQYAGQQMTTGAQAETYANHFIAVHLKEVGGGQTYAQLSAKAQADPTNTALAGQVNTMFKGETLRGLLLNAYAFGTMGTIAGIAAIFAFIAAGLMFVLSALGLWHSGRGQGARVGRGPAQGRRHRQPRAGHRRLTVRSTTEHGPAHAGPCLRVNLCASQKITPTTATPRPATTDPVGRLTARIRQPSTPTTGTRRGGRRSSRVRVSAEMLAMA